MTTVPGHNQILQQSGIVQEMHHQANAPKPSPDQAAALQQAQQVVQNSSVQLTDQAQRLKKKKESRPEQGGKQDKKKRLLLEEELALDPDATGRLLDTIV